MNERVTERASAIDAAIHDAVVQLLRDASIEINVQDVKHIPASRAHLAAGRRVYVSHLPKQNWADTFAACRAVRDAGFDPIPHVPVRLIEHEHALDEVLAGVANIGNAREVLLIAGDYAHPVGPYSNVADVLRTATLQMHGIKRVSLAGHPEGHPKVSIAEIRRTQVEKEQLARDAGLDVTVVTQFFFESTPFLGWADDLRAQGVRARLIGGLCGPANIATLFKFALRCGVGPSIRALGSHPQSVLKLFGDHRPDDLLHELAAAKLENPTGFDGVHFFCFGGYLRTCEWLGRIAR